MIGELESGEVLTVLSEKGYATAGEVLDVLKTKREMAYTTVSTTLDRLHRKNLAGRKTLRGLARTKKYLYSLTMDEGIKSNAVESALVRLTSTFGDLQAPSNFLSPAELDRLKEQVDKARG